MKKITVGKLIKNLERFHPDMEVIVITKEGGVYEKLQLSNEELGDTVVIKSS